MAEKQAAPPPSVLFVGSDTNAGFNQLCNALLRADFDVLTAHDEPEAFLMLFARQPALVVLDSRRWCSWFTRFCEVVHWRRGVPLLVLGARGDRATRLRAFLLRADDYLVEPFLVGDLVDRALTVLP